MIEYRDSQRRPIDLSRVVQPLRFLAPHILFARFVLRVDDLAGALGLRDVLRLILLQLRSQPHGERAFLGVAELDFHLW